VTWEESEAWTFIFSPVAGEMLVGRNT